jgi:2-polyprenyl-3-methyl-5-hydroxy-6-metoxy-1,4-benzoquinol methylase
VSAPWSYDLIAHEFDSIMNRYDVERRVNVVFGQLLDHVDLKQKLLLDAGCGTGIFSVEAARRGATVVGLDCGKNLLRETRRKGITSVLAGDVARMPVRDATFDIVVSSECVEHTSAPRATLRELVRVLRPGGWLVVTCPNAFWRWSCSLANALRLRPYHGLENWPSWTELRTWASEAGVRVHQQVGVHLFPFILTATHPLLRRLDRLGARFGRIYVNQCLAGQKITDALHLRHTGHTAASVHHLV